MWLQMYLGDKLIDHSQLSLEKIQQAGEREAYIQGAIQDMLERWSDELDAGEGVPQFYIKPAFPFTGL